MEREDIAPLPGYHPEIGLLLAALRDSTREWRENLGEPPIEAIVWQPAPGAHSIGALLLHIADVELFWFESFVGGSPPNPEDLKMLMSEEVRQYEGAWPQPPARPIEWYYDLLDRYRERAWKALEGVPSDRFFADGDEFETSLRWVVSHVVQHDAYHGGQAVLLHELWKKRVVS